MIYLRGGIYYPTQQTVFNKAGDSDNYIVLRSFPGEVAVIDGQNVPEGDINGTSTPTWFFRNAGYWKVIGPIHLTNGRGAGVYINGSQFVEFDQVESSYNGRRAARAGHGFFIHRATRCLSWNKHCHGWTVRGGPYEINNCAAYNNAEEAFSGISNQANIRRNTYGFGNRIGDGGGAANYSGVSVSQDDFISLDDTEMLGPRRADGGLPDTNFLKPAPEGNLNDAGVDVGITYEGSVPDIGPFEYTTTSDSGGSSGGSDEIGGNGNGSGGSGCFIGSSCYCFTYRKTALKRDALWLICW